MCVWSFGCALWLGLLAKKIQVQMGINSCHQIHFWGYEVVQVLWLRNTDGFFMIELRCCCFYWVYFRILQLGGLDLSLLPRNAAVFGDIFMPLEVGTFLIQVVNASVIWRQWSCFNRCSLFLDLIPWQ